MYYFKKAPKLNKYGWIILSIVHLFFPIIVGIKDPLGFMIRFDEGGLLHPVENLSSTIFLYGLPIYIPIIVYLWKAYFQEMSIKSLSYRKNSWDADGYGKPIYILSSSFFLFINFGIFNLIPAAIIVGCR